MKRQGRRYDAPRFAARLCVLLLMATGALGASVGCSVTPQQVFVTDVSSVEWHDPATVTIRNTDTLTRRRLQIVVRSNATLRQDTLTLRIKTLSPDSVHYEEPFALRIPHNRKAAALRREADIPYRTEVVLTDTGVYRFTFTPTRPVQGIEAIGIHIINDL